MDVRLSREEERVRAAVAEACGRIGYSERKPGGEDGPVPLAGQRELAALGALSWTLPAESGGVDGGRRLAELAAEELGRLLVRALYFETLTAAELIVTSEGPTHPAKSAPRHRDFAGTPGQAALLPSIVAGDEMVTLAVPAAFGREGGGSDALVLAGSRLSGRARFVAFADQAGRLLAGARDAAGEPVLALVAMRQGGVAFRRRDDIARGELHDVTLEDVRADVLLQGSAAMDAWAAVLPSARIRQAGYLAGLAQGALDVALEYVRRREAFGRRLGSFQALAFRLSSLHTRIDAARLFVRSVAWQSEREDVRLRAIQAHLLAASTANEAAAEAVQMHGAYGITERAKVQRYYRHAAVERVRLGRPADLLDEAAALLAERRSPAAVGAGI
jgi:alkylation response protein AidB-like acyl-CoA dehydrogenase